MLQFMRRSPTFRDLMQDLFAGTQGYLDLKSRLLRNLHGTLLDTVLQFPVEQVVPAKLKKGARDATDLDEPRKIGKRCLPGRRSPFPAA